MNLESWFLVGALPQILILGSSLEIYREWVAHWGKVLYGISSHISLLFKQQIVGSKSDSLQKIKPNNITLQGLAIPATSFACDFQQEIKSPFPLTTNFIHVVEEECARAFLVMSKLFYLAQLFRNRVLYRNILLH